MRISAALLGMSGIRACTILLDRSRSSGMSGLSDPSRLLFGIVAGGIVDRVQICGNDRRLLRGGGVGAEGDFLKAILPDTGLRLLSKPLSGYIDRKKKPISVNRCSSASRDTYTRASLVAVGCGVCLDKERGRDIRASSAEFYNRVTCLQVMTRHLLEPKPNLPTYVICNIIPPNWRPTRTVVIPCVPDLMPSEYPNTYRRPLPLR